MKLITTTEAAEKWGISSRRVVKEFIINYNEIYYG